MEKIKILFVCHGNICRSPMAEFVLRDMLRKQGLDHLVFVASRATSCEELGNDIHRGTRSILTKYGIPFERRSATELSRRDYDSYDLIIGMDRANVRNMHRIFGSDPEGKISMLLDHTDDGCEVADPWYTGNFEETYSDVKRGCEALVKEIADLLGGS